VCGERRIEVSSDRVHLPKVTENLGLSQSHTMWFFRRISSEKNDAIESTNHDSIVLSLDFSRAAKHHVAEIEGGKMDPASGLDRFTTDHSTPNPTRWWAVCVKYAFCDIRRKESNAGEERMNKARLCEVAVLEPGSVQDCLGEVSLIEIALLEVRVAEI
jgi:hypothetical protein